MMDSIRIRNGSVWRKETLLYEVDGPETLYRRFGITYPKFFKMDLLCKWAFLAAELLLENEAGTWKYQDLDKSNIAVCLSTTDGCLDVDKRYLATISDIPSPALFVYTLPNIMLGEICIRHGFKGEQLCEVVEAFDPQGLSMWVKDLLVNRSMESCIFGYCNAIGDQQDVLLGWASKKDLPELSAAQLQGLYNL